MEIISGNMLVGMGVGLIVFAFIYAKLEVILAKRDRLQHEERKQARIDEINQKIREEREKYGHALNQGTRRTKE